MKIYFTIDKHGNIAGSTTNAGVIEALPGITFKTHYVKDNELIAYTPEQTQQKATEHLYQAYWSNELMQWVDPRPPDHIAEDTATEARIQRDFLLKESDWTDTNSAPERLGSELYASWQIYRQALRDITNQPGFPLQIDWPVSPGG